MTCVVGGVPVSARLCGTLREAADSPDAPYFYECFLDFAAKPVVADEEFQDWTARIATEMQAGRQIAYCGRPV